MLNKKIVRTINNLILFPICFLFALFIFTIQPFFLFRFLNINYSRLAGIYPIEWHMIIKKNNKSKKGFDFLYANKIKCANLFWFQKWSNIAYISSFYQFFDIIVRILQYFPNNDKFIISPKPPTYSTHREWEDLKINKISLNYKYMENTSDIIQATKPIINLTSKEIENGKSLLIKLGVTSSSKFICFHARDSLFLDKTIPEVDWSYHNYRDSSIQNYIPAMEFLSDKGFHCLRMGSIVKDKFITNKKNEIVDYSLSDYRSEFMDVYLSANCKFFIGSDCGITCIPEVFRVPCVYVNWVNIRRISNWVINGLFIFKKVYSKKYQRFLKFSEIIDLDIDNQNVRADMQIELLENTPEEIQEVANEMNERLNNNWQSNAEDELLQKKFWSLFGNQYIKSENLRIGQHFLKHNINLLI